MTDVWVVRHWPSQSWWGPNGAGYRGDLLMAGTYSQEKAKQLELLRSPMKNGRREDIAMPLADAVAFVRHGRSIEGCVMASALLTPAHVDVFRCAEVQRVASITLQAAHAEFGHFYHVSRQAREWWERACTDTERAAQTLHDQVPR